MASPKQFTVELQTTHVVTVTACSKKHALQQAIELAPKVSIPIQENVYFRSSDEGGYVENGHVETHGHWQPISIHKHQKYTFNCTTEAGSVRDS